MKPLQFITRENFAAFGTVIALPDTGEENWYIVDGDTENPWRIAVLRHFDKEITTFECHPTSKESFEPLAGTTVLVVAEPDSPADWQAFLLDKPVCLKKSVWHQVLSLTDSAQVKITENYEVTAEFYELKEPISVVVG